MAAKRGGERVMLWIDQDSYFGPDRRAKPRGFRLRERRRRACAGEPPSLHVALRHLRLRVLDAHGPGADDFAQRLTATALLAEMRHEREAAFELSSLSASVARHRGEDIRPVIYEKIDRAHALLRAA
jgi:hypothetical protein